jgi:transcriptional regulator with XRE-family HTH domain
MGPNANLRREREARGWSMEDAADHLAEAVIRRGWSGPRADSHLIGRWERGERNPRPRSVQLLCDVYEKSPAELGLLPPEDDVNRRRFLRTALGSSAALLIRADVDWSQAATIAEGAGTPGLTAADIERLTGSYEQLRRRVSGRFLIGPVRSHVDFVARYLREHSLTSTKRDELVSALGEAAVLAGRLAFWDLQDEAGARHYFEVAGAASREASSPSLQAYALAFTAELATYVGQPTRAVEGSQAAQAAARGSVAPRARSWLASVEAEARAHFGDVDGCLGALDRAREAMDRAGPDDENPQWIDFFDQPRLAGYEGACLVTIGQSRRALQALQRAAAITDPLLTRYHAEIAADMAWGFAQQSEIAEACEFLASAVDSAASVGYSEGLKRARAVRRHLDPWRDEKAVRRLDDRLRQAWLG